MGVQRSVDAVRPSNTFYSQDDIQTRGTLFMARGIVPRWKLQRCGRDQSLPFYELLSSFTQPVVVEDDTSKAGCTSKRREQRHLVTKNGNRQNDEKDNLDVAQHLQRHRGGGLGHEKVSDVEEEGDERRGHYAKPQTTVKQRFVVDKVVLAKQHPAEQTGGRARRHVVQQLDRIEALIYGREQHALQDGLQSACERGDNYEPEANWMEVDLALDCQSHADADKSKSCPHACRV
mmetsp:Transcript_9903/g.25558  ORF Transcript_9903/g.25558 Transcript_9903/m.25558 type:complete len:233 (+) Transcript_9903:555-1253(+)